MERGVGGRIEDAFQAAKDRGEAAFVTFVTAGYPSVQGKVIAACWLGTGWFDLLCHVSETQGARTGLWW